MSRIFSSIVTRHQFCHHFLRKYKFVDAFPLSIGIVQLDYDTTNAIETFDVEFQYNFFTSNTSESGGLGVNISIDTPIGSFPINI